MWFKSEVILVLLKCFCPSSSLCISSDVSSQPRNPSRIKCWKSFLLHELPSSPSCFSSLSSPRSLLFLPASCILSLLYSFFKPFSQQFLLKSKICRLIWPQICVFALMLIPLTLLCYESFALTSQCLPVIIANKQPLAEWLAQGISYMLTWLEW